MKRFALILGASGGIGSAIARQMADDGWSLYLHYHKTELAAFADELSGRYTEQEFVIVQGDFMKDGGAQQVADQIFDCSCIVCASGHALYSLLEDTSHADFDALWRAHVKNPIETVRFVSPYFRRHAKSYVIFIASIWGETGASMETAYSAAKGAQLAFTKAYAKEMAPSGTRVNAVSPGLIRTKMNNELTAEEWRELEEEIPLGAGSPEDIAHTVSFLTSGKADYITGQTIRVNGGWLI
ncbi:elongation factor P 5-aminopentanone reductase [Planococcus maritimus]|uniref:elongation factor P 5-aminopentanone reductase n=1 Tax=Planococcus maritimus TaxID=192421 RepID=UPI00079A608A|nr:SDR family oxidoreductase [Planococcus maritimus]KYG58948.1 3-ketoacyl-ACP synthase [Planococcus maritimus]OED32652.1 3-ketoacyl-ACP synthase [Planococcus maritimus]